MNSIARILALGLLPLSAIGCTSIQSDAVRELIDFQSRKIKQANQNITAVRTDTDKSIREYEKALKQIEAQTRNAQRRQIAKALALSSGVKPDSWTKEDFGEWSEHGSPHAPASLFFSQVAGDSLDKASGLDPKIRKQYQEDFEALRKTTAALEASWKEIDKLHRKVEAYANQTVFASIDSEFIAAVAGEIPDSAEYFEKAVKAADKLNDVLDKASDRGLLETPGTQSALDDLVKLLEESAPKEPAAEGTPPGE